MHANSSMVILNDERENRKLLVKLPDWLVSRWGRIVLHHRETHGRFPPFSDFKNFLEREANIACDPITSLQSLRGNDKE